MTPAVMEAFDHVYVTKEILSDNEFNVKQDIHAKIYYSTAKDANYLYLGSANASQNAFYKNVECLLRLRYMLHKIGYLKFSADFIPAENCPYEELTEIPVIEAEDNRKKEIDTALREAVYAVKRAVVSPNGDQYSVMVGRKKSRQPSRKMPVLAMGAAMAPTMASGVRPRMPAAPKMLLTRTPMMMPTPTLTTVMIRPLARGTPAFLKSMVAPLQNRNTARMGMAPDFHR